MTRLTVLASMAIWMLWLGADTADAVDFETEALTEVRIDGDVGGNFPSSFKNNVGTFTEREYRFDADPAFSSPGSLHGKAYADFGTLKALVEVTGPSGQRGLVRATFNEVFTVNGGTGAGAMQIGFEHAGPVEVWDNVDPNDPSAGVVIGDPDGPFATSVFSILSGPTEVYRSEQTLEHGENIDGFPSSMAVVPFTYGVPFNVAVSLFLVVTTDNNYLGFSNGRSNYGGGDAQYVLFDAFNSSELSTIVLPQDATLSSVSGFDYTPFVTAPEPGPWALGVLCLLGLGTRGLLGGTGGRRH